MSRVTPAERRALEAKMRMGTVKGAAHQLGLSPHTVVRQLAAARERLGVQTTIEAVRIVFVERAET